jgi:hypothetical protein
LSRQRPFPPPLPRAAPVCNVMFCMACVVGSTSDCATCLPTFMLQADKTCKAPVLACDSSCVDDGCLTASCGTANICTFAPRAAGASCALPSENGACGNGVCGEQRPRSWAAVVQSARTRCEHAMRAQVEPRGRPCEPHHGLTSSWCDPFPVQSRPRSSRKHRCPSFWSLGAAPCRPTPTARARQPGPWARSLASFPGPST